MTGLIEQVVEGSILNLHWGYTAKNSDGAVLTQEWIVVGNLVWEKGLGGWGPSRPVTSTLTQAGLVRSASLIAGLKFRSKDGTVLLANRQVDAYRISNVNNELGTVYVDFKSCLPVLISTTRDGGKTKTSMTFEWNIPIKITPPGP